MRTIEMPVKSKVAARAPKFLDQSTPCMRKGRDREEWKKGDKLGLSCAKLSISWSWPSFGLVL